MLITKSYQQKRSLSLHPNRQSNRDRQTYMQTGSWVGRKRSDKHTEVTKLRHTQIEIYEITKH